MNILSRPGLSGPALACAAALALSLGFAAPASAQCAGGVAVSTGDDARVAVSVINPAKASAEKRIVEIRHGAATVAGIRTPPVSQPVVYVVDAPGVAVEPSGAAGGSRGNPQTIIVR